MAINITPKNNNIGRAVWTPLKGVLVVVVFLLLVWWIWNVFGSANSNPKKKEQSLEEENKGSVAVVPVPEKPLIEDLPEDDIFGSRNGKNNKEEKPSVPPPIAPSYYEGWFSLSRGTAQNETYPGKEYVTISVTQNNLSSLDLNDWSLKNSGGKSVRLGAGTPIFFGGEYRPYIRVQGGDKLIIVTGESPVAPWFRINKCSGYLEEFEDFIPPIPERCPRVSYESGYYSQDKACREFIGNNVFPCQIPTASQSNLSSACRGFIASTTGYTACTALHKNDTDFNTNEWRVYLGQSAEMWKEGGEYIRLLDAQGKLVAEVKY